MRSLFLAGALALIAAPVVADEVIVAPGATVEHHDDAVVKEKTVREDANGCSTKSVTKSNDMGDSVTKTQTNC